jgi:predicted TIM-barrel fold metal-dependent hydrolase
MAELSSVPLVDSHAHVWTKDMPLVSNPRHRPNYEFTTEQYLAELDAHGIRYGVITGASIFGTYNDYTIAAVRKHKRLRGTVLLDPSTDRQAMERMNQVGIVGVRLPWISLPTIPDINSEEYRGLLRRIAELNWHIHLHVGLGRLPAILPQIETSGVRIVVDHFGNPDPKLGVNCPGFQAVLRSIDNGRTWVKLSAAYRVGRDAAKVYARELLKVAGPERLVWGSDAPYAGFEASTTYRQTLDDFMDWVPDTAARHQIGSVTTMELYFE